MPASAGIPADNRRPPDGSFTVLRSTSNWGFNRARGDASCGSFREPRKVSPESGIGSAGVSPLGRAEGLRASATIAGSLDPTLLSEWAKAGSEELQLGQAQSFASEVLGRMAVSRIR